MNRVLVLSVKKKWFDLIKSGEKKEEYRKLNEYWKKRLGFKAGYYKNFKFIEFRNGYGFNVPKFKVELLSIQVQTPNPKWIDNSINFENCFVLQLGAILPSE
jgi:hypothetical protein